MPEFIQSTSLYFTNERSDKVYHAHIAAEGDGYIVSFSYGARNASLRTGTKTQSPVSLEKAKSIFDKLIRSKTAKGYTEQSDGAVYTSESRNDESSGFLCQLLTPIDDDEAHCLVDNDNFIMQRKYDGVRLTVQFKDGIVRGINRKGLYVGISTEISNCYAQLAAKNNLTSFIIDGEGLGDKHATFDILEINGECLKKEEYLTRFKKLILLIPDNEKHTHEPVFLTHYAQGFENKDKMLQFGLKNKWEGVVFKHEESPYQAGRSNNKHIHLKYKFYKTASVMVQSINDKRSVAIVVFNDQHETVSVGNVTIPANVKIPAPGTILECRYLYALKSNALFQPTYIMERDDISANQCSLNQLEYKEGI